MRYILGFDGGGTKTECVLMNSADQVLARTYAGPSNPSRIGVESAARAVEESAELALRETGLQRSAVTAVGAGLAGTAKTDMKERMRGALQKCFPGAAVTILTDLEAALAAAGEGPAIVLVVGTGSELGKQILAQLRCTEWPVVQHRAQTMPDEIFPPLFPVIAAAADSGDATAQRILVGAAQEVSSLVADVADRLHLREKEFLLAKTA